VFGLEMGVVALEKGVFALKKSAYEVGEGEVALNPGGETN